MVITNRLRSRFLHLRTRIELFADVAGLGTNLHVTARNFDTNVVEARTARGVVAEVILVAKVGTDLIQHRCYGLSLCNIESASRTKLRKRFQCPRIDQKAGADRDKIEKGSGLLSFLHNIVRNRTCFHCHFHR